MKKEQLLRLLTGTETPRFINDRENSLIDKIHTLLNALLFADEKLNKAWDIDPETLKDLGIEDEVIMTIQDAITSIMNGDKPIGENGKKELTWQEATADPVRFTPLAILEFGKMAVDANAETIDLSIECTIKGKRYKISNNIIKKEI